MTTLISAQKSILAALIVAVCASAPAMAAEDGKCRTDISYTTLVPLDATPENIEVLRNAFGAKEVRVERKGTAYTAEFNEYRLRINVDADNKISGYRCG
ncbi:I78 family peptidase inhibitor [Pseudomonas sp. SIMBA_077]